MLPKKAEIVEVSPRDGIQNEKTILTLDAKISLIDRAIAAGAKRIEIEIQAGGTQLIRVRDDGVGIAHEDLRLALSRHATSKIASLKDLESVSTLGFRGEALPSIASVAQLKLTSHARGEESGWSVEADGSMVSDPRPAAHPVGTTIEVRDLFFNTPARRKFLKTERTEYSHVDAALRSLALGRFDVEWHLKHNQRPMATRHQRSILPGVPASTTKSVLQPFSR